MTAATVPPCPRKCRGGHKCICNGEHPHTQHICNRPGCICHAPRAYGLTLVVRNGRAEYVRIEEVQP